MKRYEQSDKSKKTVRSMTISKNKRDEQNSPGKRANGSIKSESRRKFSLPFILCGGVTVESPTSPIFVMYYCVEPIKPGAQGLRTLQIVPMGLID